MNHPSQLPEKMSLDNDTIRSQVLKLQKFVSSREMRVLKNNNQRAFEAECEKKFNVFKFTLPALYKMILDKGKKFEMERLEQMLSMKKDVDTNKTDYDVASKKVGLQYYKDFVDKNGPPSDK
jgi:hypothetical protein